MLKRGLFLILIIILLTQPSMAAYIAVTEPELENAVVQIYDSNLLLGQEHSVFMLQDGAQHILIDNIPGKISALAVGDINGDLQDDLVVGTGTGGALYFYTKREGNWERQGQTQYLWDTISFLEIHDFNNDGWGDLVLLTEKGEAHVLLSQEGILQPFWRSPAGEFVVSIEIIDVDHNGYPDLIYALRSGYIGILTWDEPNFITLWENYPWGSVESLVVLPHTNSPEWLVVTGQKMLYGWRWRNGEVSSSRLFDASALGEHLFYIPEEGLLSISKTTGISLFELQSGNVIEKWRVPGLFGDEAFYYQGEFYFRDHNQNYSRLVEGSTKWRLFIHDTEVTDSVGVVSSGDQLYFNLSDLIDYLGLVKTSWHTWSFIVEDIELRLNSQSTLIEYGELAIPLTNPVLESEGQPYVTAEVFPLFGWNVELDPTRQFVVFLKNWGWWL